MYFGLPYSFLWAFPPIKAIYYDIYIYAIVHSPGQSGTSTQPANANKDYVKFTYSLLVNYMLSNGNRVLSTNGAQIKLYTH